MAFDKEFKEALSELKPSEKDKLILRLLRRDKTLADRLYFELVGTQSPEERRTEMEALIKARVKSMSGAYYSLGWLVMDMRTLSGEITEHVKITKDKFGEVSLNLLMLNEVLRYNTDRIEKARMGKSYTMCIYIVARAYKLLLLIKGLHEDLLVDLKEDLELLGTQIGKSHSLMKTAINNGLDVNWLTTGEIPEDIKQMHAELRKNGFLK